MIDVAHYEAYDLFKPPESDIPVLTFGQQRPDMSTYTTEPPTIPVVLAKAAFVAVEPPFSKMPPNIPLHCIATHFFHDFGRTASCRTRVPVLPEKSQVDAQTGLIEGEPRVLLTAVTYRFDGKYSTSVLVTRGSKWVMQRAAQSRRQTIGVPEHAMAVNALRATIKAKGAKIENISGRTGKLAMTSISEETKKPMSFAPPARGKRAGDIEFAANVVASSMNNGQNSGGQNSTKFTIPGALPPEHNGGKNNGQQKDSNNGANVNPDMIKGKGGSSTGSRNPSSRPSPTQEPAQPVNNGNMNNGVNPNTIPNHPAPSDNSFKTGVSPGGLYHDQMSPNQSNPPSGRPSQNNNPNVNAFQNNPNQNISGSAYNNSVPNNPQQVPQYYNPGNHPYAQTAPGATMLTNYMPQGTPPGHNSSPNPSPQGAEYAMPINPGMYPPQQMYGGQAPFGLPPGGQYGVPPLSPTQMLERNFHQQGQFVPDGNLFVNSGGQQQQGGNNPNNPNNPQNMPNNASYSTAIGGSQNVGQYSNYPGNAPNNFSQGSIPNEHSARSNDGSGVNGK